MTRRLQAVLALALAAAALWWLRDPPFAPRMETGLRPWTTGPDDIPYRWTAGRASAFVDSSWPVIDVPLRATAFSPGWLPVIVELAVDGTPVDRVALDDERWHSRRLVVDGLRTSRRFRRLDLRVNRVWSDGYYGVQLGGLRRGMPE